VWTAPVTGPGEQGNEPTCCIKGRVKVPEGGKRYSSTLP